MTDREIPPLRVGVIGAGAWATQSHLKTLTDLGNDIVMWAVCRRDAARLAAVRDAFGFRHAFTDYRELVRSGIDICIVSSPAASHFEHARAALEAGAHVLVEKPFTVDPRHARALVDLARAAGRHLVVSYGYNYRPIAELAKSVMLDGRIGTMEFVSVSMGSAVRPLLCGGTTGHSPTIHHGWQPSTYVDPAVSGGGYAQAQLTHALGLALWLTDLSASEVFAFMSPAGHRIDLHDAVGVRFVGGAIGTVSGSASYIGGGVNRHHLTIRIIGSKGQLELDVEHNRLRFVGADMKPVEFDLDEEAGKYEGSGPLRCLVGLASGGAVPNRSTGELGARVVELIDAAYRSQATHRRVEIRLHAKTPAET